MSLYLLMPLEVGITLFYLPSYFPTNISISPLFPINLFLSFFFPNCISIFKGIENSQGYLRTFKDSYGHLGALWRLEEITQNRSICCIYQHTSPQGIPKIHKKNYVHFIPPRTSSQTPQIAADIALQDVQSTIEGDSCNIYI